MNNLHYSETIEDSLSVILGEIQRLKEFSISRENAAAKENKIARKHREYGYQEALEEIEEFIENRDND